MGNWHNFAVWLPSNLKHFVFCAVAQKILSIFATHLMMFLSSTCITADSFIADTSDNEMCKSLCRTRSTGRHNNLCWALSLFTSQTNPSLKTCSNTLTILTLPLEFYLSSFRWFLILNLKVSAIGLRLEFLWFIISDH